MVRKSTEAIVRYSEADWVEAAKMDTVMQGMQASQWPAVVVVTVLATLTYSSAPRPLFLAVLAFSLFVAGVRHLFVRDYQRLRDDGQVDAQLAYLHRRRWFWALNAVGWGFWPLLFHGRLPAQSEVVCWMLSAGVGGVAIGWMSAHLRTTRVFLMTFLACVAASVVLNLLFRSDRLAQASDFWFPAILGGYWFLLFRISRRLNELYAGSIDLTYHNARLIHSLREQTRAADDAARFKDRFLANAAHDLKQPVNALGIYAEWLSAEPDLVDELGPKILQSVHAINTLFDSLFDLAKLDAGRFETDIQEVRIGPLLSELELQFRPQAMQKGLTLRVRPLDTTLQTDPIMLRRVVGNLVANAVRYTQQGGILLTARRRRDAIVFEIWDTGIGIADHEHEQIFGEFYKVQTTGTEEGFGLGLAIVQRLSERLGYRVSMRSRPGRGTVFRVWASAEHPDAAAGLTKSAGHSSARSAASESGSSPPDGGTAATDAP